MDKAIILDKDFRRVACIEEGFRYPPERSEEWKPGTYRVIGTPSFTVPSGKHWDATTQKWQ